MNKLFSVLLVFVCGFLASTGYCQTVIAPVCQSSNVMYSAFESAPWPADAVKLGKALQYCHPDSVTKEAVSKMERYKKSEEALKRTSLYRSGFLSAKAEYQLQAGLGDPNTSLIAANDIPDGPRKVGWLEYAALLGNGTASLLLSKHYREKGQMVEASKWLHIANVLGAEPGKEFDNVRKWVPL